MTNYTHTIEEKTRTTEHNGPEWDPVKNKPVPVVTKTLYELVHMWVRLDWRQLSDEDLLAEHTQLVRERELLEADLEDPDPEVSYLAENAIALLDVSLEELGRIGRARARLAKREGKRTPFKPTELSARFEAARSLDLVAVIAVLTGQDPVPKGNSSWVRCPFHGGGTERTPSLQIYHAQGRGWFCHACRVGGDAVSFVCNLKGTSRVSALRLLAELFTFPGES